MKPKILAAIILALFASAIFAIAVRGQVGASAKTVDFILTWDAPTNVVPDGYNLYWGDKDGELTNTMRITGGTTAVVEEQPMHKVIEFRVTATLGGLESIPSEPVFYTPLAPPTGLTVKQITLTFRPE